jgi:hypothetical protein
VATRSLIHSAKQSKLAVIPFPSKPKPRPQKSARRISRAVLRSAIRDRLRAYRADDCRSYAWQLEKPGMGV